MDENPQDCVEARWSNLHAIFRANFLKFPAKYPAKRKRRIKSG